MPPRIIFHGKRLPAAGRQCGALPVSPANYPTRAQQRFRPESRGVPVGAVKPRRPPGLENARNCWATKGRARPWAARSLHRFMFYGNDQPASGSGRAFRAASVRSGAGFFSNPRDATYGRLVVSLCGHRQVRSAIGRRPYAPRRSTRGQSQRRARLPYKPAASRATGQPTSD